MRLCLSHFHMWRRGCSIHVQNDEMTLNQTKYPWWTYQYPVQSLSESWLGRTLKFWVSGSLLDPGSHTHERCQVSAAFNTLRDYYPFGLDSSHVTADNALLKGTCSRLVTCHKEFLAVRRFHVHTTSQNSQCSRISGQWWGPHYTLLRRQATLKDPNEFWET